MTETQKQQREELQRQLTLFKDSEQMEKSFDASLSAFQRLCVHEISDSLGLRHVSSGRKPNRFITVSKEPQVPVAAAAPEESSQETKETEGAQLG